MKHFLPILTAALALTATTASAAYYYDYYLDNPTEKVSGISSYNAGPNDVRETDTVRYKDFSVVRYSQANNGLLVPTSGTNNTNFYKIQIAGDDPTSNQKVKLYLTDYVTNMFGDNSNALYNNVTKYGYRVLNSDGTVGETQYIDMPQFSELTSDDVIDTVGQRNRYKYELGTFDQGVEIELFMENAKTGYSAYSYNGLPESALGGYGDGGYYPEGIVEATDKMLTLGYYKTVAEANKAMPLAGLDIAAVDGGRARIYFGIIGESVTVTKEKEIVSGQPLPGGLQIALIAGLFGLGFWYIRRRKATVA